MNIKSFVPYVFLIVFSFCLYLIPVDHPTINDIAGFINIFNAIFFLLYAIQLKENIYSTERYFYPFSVDRFKLFLKEVFYLAKHPITMIYCLIVFAFLNFKLFFEFSNSEKLFLNINSAMALGGGSIFIIALSIYINSKFVNYNDYIFFFRFLLLPIFIIIFIDIPQTYYPHGGIFFLGLNYFLSESLLWISWSLPLALIFTIYFLLKKILLAKWLLN